MLAMMASSRLRSCAGQWRRSARSRLAITVAHKPSPVRPSLYPSRNLFSHSSLSSDPESALNEKAWLHRNDAGVGHTWVVDAIVQIETDKLPRQTMYNHIYDAFYGFLQDPEPSANIGERLKREIWTMGSLAEIFVCCKNESERGEDAQFLEQVSHPAALTTPLSARACLLAHLSCPYLPVARTVLPESALARFYHEARHDGAARARYGRHGPKQRHVLEEGVCPRLAESVMLGWKSMCMLTTDEPIVLHQTPSSFSYKLNGLV